jgi:hypothetical protein
MKFKYILDSPLRAIDIIQLMRIIKKRIAVVHNSTLAILGDPDHRASRSR